MDIHEIVTSRASGLGEKVFCAPNIPKDKLEGAVEGITNSRTKPEDVIAVLDITLFGACDNGVVFTNRAMYFCPLMGDSQEVVYEDMVSASSKGALLKELVVTTVNGGTIKIEASDFNGKVAAMILNAIISAKNEERRRAERVAQRNQGNDNPKIANDKTDFEKVRSRIQNNSIALIVIGIILCCCCLFWWGGAAIVIGIELLSIYTHDAGLYEMDMPVSVYEKDVKELIGRAWFGAIILLGVFGVSVAGKKSKNRIDAIRKALTGIKACKEEKIITSYLRHFGAKEDPLARDFVGEYLDRSEERCEFVRLPLGEITMIFEPSFLDKSLADLDAKAKSETRISRQELIDFVKSTTGMEDLQADNFINLPDSGIEAYSFDDGTYYIHGINNDRVKVCASCGIATFVDPDVSDDNDSNAEYYCSDYCRETEDLCKKIIEDLRTEKFAKEGVDTASFGGALPAIIDAIRDNRRGVGKRPRIVTDEAGVEHTIQTGHGVAAEKANTRIDKLFGKSASTLGDDNSANGPDRIVDGKLIQTKYFASPMQSVEAGFGKDGNYKYIDGSGQPMQLEVPRDQYEKAVALMREKIKEGKVPGVADPAEADKLVRKGHLSYKQAQNLCKFGTIESLAYDAYTGVIVGATAGGISFVLTTAISYYKTKDLKQSVRAALGASIETGGKAFAVYVLSAQVQRTAFVKAVLHKSAVDINWGGHGKFVERLGRGLDKMSGAKSGSFSKNANVAVKGAAITAAATFAVTSAWEVGKLCCGKMSGMQCVKNIAVSGGGIAAGTAGALILGALMTPIPGGTFIGGLLGGAIGGMIGSGVTKAGMDKLIQDDAIMIMALVSDEFKIIAAGFCLNGDEIQEATAELDKIISENKHFIEDVYSKKTLRRHYLARIMKPIFISICMKRPVLFNRDVSASAIEDSVIDV